MCVCVAGSGVCVTWVCRGQRAGGSWQVEQLTGGQGGACLHSLEVERLLDLEVGLAIQVGALDEAHLQTHGAGGGRVGEFR